MTNGEKLQQMFPNAEVCRISQNYFNRYNRVTGLRFKGETETVWFPISWWNSEYKESETENDSSRNG